MDDCENRIAKIQVPYAPGKLVAISRNEAGEEVARHEIMSAGEPAGIKVTTDRDTLQADNQDLAHITVEIVDENGIRVPSATDAVQVEVQGKGRLVGMDNGDLTSHETYDTCRRHAYHGRCLAIVRAGHTPGPIKVTVIVPGLPRQELTLTATGS
jgi:beta-galactosidase